VQNGNTDRALKRVLGATGLATEFISLKDYSVAPCRACLGCVETHCCVIPDDGIALADKVKQADALVIAGYTPYSSLDSRTKAFMERLYPLRHKKGLLAGKPGGAVITCAVPADNEKMPPAFDFGSNVIKFFMMEEGMEFLGSVRVDGNVPCVRCGYGDACTMSGITMLFGQEATVESVGINSFEEQPEAVKAAVELGESLTAFLKGKNKAGG
jgi:multimeric flavodoxin WrbA